MKFRQYLIAIVLLLPALCIAGSIYEDARQQAITLFDKCDYRTAAKQFIAVQDIAPVVNDLSSWIIKCNKQIAIQNNKVRPTRTSSKKTTSNATTQVEVVDDGFVVYDSIGHYNDGGIALARLNGKYGYVNRSKDVIVPIIYDNTDIFGSPSTISVGSWSQTYSYKGDWKGTAMSVQRDGKWGFADSHGKEIIPCKYDIVENSIISQGDSLLAVGLDDKFGFVDLSGNVVIPLNYEFAGRFFRGVAPVVLNGKLGFTNTHGDIVVDCIYDPKYVMINGKVSIDASFLLSDTTAIRKNGKWGLINIQGEEVHPFKYDELVSSSAQWDMRIFTFKKDGNKIFVFNGNEYTSEDSLEEAKLKHMAGKGNPEFIYNLAAYYWDKGEYNPASVWAEKGDQLGHAGCSRLLGAYWLFYTNTPGMAFTYLSKAAKADDDIAQYFLGLMYEEDLVNCEPKSKYKISNKKNAIDWYKKSASNGNQQAKEKLSSMGEKY